MSGLFMCWWKKSASPALTAEDSLDYLSGFHNPILRSGKNSGSSEFEVKIAKNVPQTCPFFAVGEIKFLWKKVKSYDRWKTKETVFLCPFNMSHGEEQVNISAVW